MQGMSNQLRFIVSHGGKFVYVDDEWKWRGDKTTSIVVPTSITLGGLVLRLKEKLGILDSRTKIELKFKVPNMNIPPAEICEDEDLNWYISVHKETAICVTIFEVEHQAVHMGRDTNFQNPSFVAVDVHRKVQHDEVDQLHGVSNDNAPDALIFYFGAAPIDENLDNPLCGLETVNFVDGDEQMSSHSRNSDKVEWITSVNMLTLATGKYFLARKSCTRKFVYLPCETSSNFEFRRSAHRHAASSVIAEHILGRLDNPNRSYDPTAIGCDMEREFGVKISYIKARRGKVSALHMLHGGPKDNFQKLFSYCHVLGESNLGAVTHIEVDSRNKFHYFFLAFGASIRGCMQYLRFVICDDGSRLKCSYKDDVEKRRRVDRGLFVLTSSLPSTGKWSPPVLESMNTGSRGKGTERKETKEVLKPVDDRKLGKRGAAVKADKKPAMKGKAAKQDPNKPKWPPSAFFIFLEEFRKTFKKENPDLKGISAVGKAGGEKWKSMSAAEKAPYEAKAAKKKAEYGRLMDAYNKKQESSADEGSEESDRSKSEVHDEDDESVQEEEDDSGEEDEEEEEDDSDDD